MYIQLENKQTLLLLKFKSIENTKHLNNNKLTIVDIASDKHWMQSSKHTVSENLNALAFFINTLAFSSL